MSIKLFISWSGGRSQSVALALRNWVPDVIQGVKPWVSTEDVKPGKRWNREIAKQLEASDFGILCLTPENLSNPWLLFEAGALAKTLDKSLVCPYLYDLDPAYLKGVGPLEQFQAARANREDTFNLVGTINQLLGEDRLPDDRLGRSFKRCWPELEQALVELDGVPRPACDSRAGMPFGSDLGLESIHPTRGAALETFVQYLEAEIERGQKGEPARIWIVSSSLRGFIVQSGAHFNGRAMLGRIAKSSCDFRVLMTHPQMADHRAKQEDRDAGDIPDEIAKCTAMLKNTGIKEEQIKFYPGTPTVFAIAAGERMLLNPYPYETEAQGCFSLIVQKTRNPKDIYHQYLEYHFERPWRRI